MSKKTITRHLRLVHSQFAKPATTKTLEQPSQIQDELGLDRLLASLAQNEKWAEPISLSALPLFPLKND